MQKRKSRARMVILPALVMALVLPAVAHAAPKMKTETFDRDPGWIGVNNRSARQGEPVQIRQDFGHSRTNHAGGAAGEMGGFISPAGEVAYFAARIEPLTFKDKFAMSGTLYVGEGGTHVLLGLFNAETVNEWRTPNTVSMRINGRGDKFFAYVEYCTSKWRAGGDTTPFPSVTDENGRWNLLGFESKKPYKWSISYDPAGNGGKGVVTATIDDKTAICNLESGHKEDGATFNRIGLMNIMKSADLNSTSEIYIDNLTFNGKTETFDKDPNWEGRDNRRTYGSRIVRPWFDFGFSPTNFAGGKKKGELGGQIFRGDCRYPERMGCYGAKIGPLTLDKPIKASGKVAMTRGVTDSTVLFGFYNQAQSMRSNPSQDQGVPESVLGIHLEGPSAEGFLFYPVYRLKGTDARVSAYREFPHIHPDGKSHDWSLEYDPAGADGKGQITVTFYGTSKTFDLHEGDKSRGATFDRFGIVTSWIDGNSVDAYWDDITYTVAQ